MRKRPYWSALYERDLDLVLLELLHSAPAFRTWLLATVAPNDVPREPEPAFAGAWHSVTDELGHESDIEAEWHLPGGGRLILLIEDKLGAHCQPDQAKRYLARAERYRETERATQTITVLVAPSWYPTKHQSDVAPFERHIAIEEISAWCDSGTLGERGAYVAALLRHAVARILPVSPDRDTAAKRLAPVYAVLRGAIASSGSALEVTSTTEWVYFNFPGRKTGVWLRYRIPDNWVELVFAKKEVGAEIVSSVFATAPLPDASITDRGTTETAVWCPTPEVDVNVDITPQRDRLLAALRGAEALRAWYLDHVNELHLPEVGSADSTAASPDR